MKIILAKTAGFCFGVNRAVQTVYDLINEGKAVCTLGPIIHNPQLVEKLEQKGVRTVESPEQVGGGQTLVIRSHGVGADVYQKAKQLGINVVDATCPFVAKIHKIVSSAKGSVLIAGDKNHKEVIGIMGHCKGDVYVFADDVELQNLLQNHPNFQKDELTVVCQTTINAKIWEKSQKIVKKVCTNANLFDTICNATSARQSEAMELSDVCDAMIVVGGRHSSNTVKLYDICKARCEKTVLVETAAELCVDSFKGCECVGVVAGASTPATIIKEVTKTMSENLQTVEEQLEEKETVTKTIEEMTDEEAMEASLSNLTDNQKVKGVVLSVNSTEVQVDIGRGLAGYITAEEFSNDPTVNLVEEVKAGDVLDLIIMRTNDQEGTVMLSKRRFDAIAGWDKIVEAEKNGEILEGTVVEIVNGGVVVATSAARVFIPASHATISRDEPIEQLKGQKVSFKLLKVEQRGRRRRAVGSIRLVLRDELRAERAKFWETIAEGERYTGTVKSITGYGAFVDLGGVDGMVHISELSWARIKHPSEVVCVGDKIEVYVKALDKDAKKISLGYKKPEDNPWVKFIENNKVDDVINVTIVSVTPYGAFARILPGVDGLIHISQIANKRVEKPQDELSVGDKVDVKIIGIDEDKKRISLSIRALAPEAPAEEAVEAPAEEAVEAPTEEAAE